MSLEIKIVEDIEDDTLNKFLLNVPNKFIYHNWKYKKFLEKILPESKYLCVLALDGDTLVGVLPFFICYGKFGAVVNSMPFYGSYGGVLSKPGIDKGYIDEILINFDNYCKKNEVVCATLILPPLNTNTAYYSNFKSNFFDHRIGQITPLSRYNSAPGKDIGEKLFSFYHTDTRRMIRKGLKSGFSVSHNDNDETINAIYNIHTQNILAIGGLPKTKWKNCFMLITFLLRGNCRVLLSCNNPGV
jgi:hypothetical protein